MFLDYTSGFYYFELGNKPYNTRSVRALLKYYDLRQRNALLRRALLRDVGRNISVMPFKTCIIRLVI